MESSCDLNCALYQPISPLHSLCSALLLSSGLRFLVFVYCPPRCPATVLFSPLPSLRAHSRRPTARRIFLQTLPTRRNKANRARTNVEVVTTKPLCAKTYMVCPFPTLKHAGDTDLTSKSTVLMTGVSTALLNPAPARLLEKLSVSRSHGASSLATGHGSSPMVPSPAHTSYRPRTTFRSWVSATSRRSTLLRAMRGESSTRTARMGTVSSALRAMQRCMAGRQSGSGAGPSRLTGTWTATGQS